MSWAIEYYATAKGKSPVRDFIDSLSPESKAKYIFIANLLGEYGIGVKEPYVKPLIGSRKLFEIRIKDKNNIHRILFFTFTGKKFVLLHGFTKKTEKTPRAEIETATKRMDAYLTGRRQ